MKRLGVVSVFLLSLVSFGAFAAPNFQCEIFRTVGGGYAAGKLTLSGEGFQKQSFELSLTDSADIEPSQFDGTLYLKGQVAFTDLDLDTQKDIISAMNSSRRPNLTTGPMILFSNVEDDSEMSTLNVYLMPSGQIAYIEAGLIPVLCM